MVQGSSKATLLRALCCVLVVLSVANAFAYAATTAGWVPVSDNWYFMDRIVYPYAHGDLHAWDLLVKRGALDHAQPLRRLLLLANYEWFDLDFRIEALSAVAFGIAALALLGVGMRRELRAGGDASWLLFAALAAVYFSMSAPMVFTWSLLGLGFSSHVFLFLWLVAAWRVVEVPSPGRVGILVLSTFLFGLVADDTALVATIAVVIAAALLGWRDRARRGGAAVQAIACIVGIALYLAFYKAAAPATGGVPAAHAATLHGSGVFAHLGDAWQWIVVPLASAFVHRATLHAWFGAAGGIAIVALGLLAALAHLWFWKQVLAGARNRTAFMATTIMLLFYGLVAGIVLGRVAEFGSQYLWQPRYAFIYRWHVVALLMMLVAQWPRMAAVGKLAAWSRGFALAAAAGIIALQLPLGASAWKDAKYLRRANAGMARQLLAMGDDAAMRPPPACAPQLVVCRFDEARRLRIVGFLRSQRLNAFSAEVRARNDYPQD
jgi:hypothetical protein